jgi:hypothetical protein
MSQNEVKSAVERERAIFQHTVLKDCSLFAAQIDSKLKATETSWIFGARVRMT